jgi:hypothetical protein
MEIISQVSQKLYNLSEVFKTEPGRIMFQQLVQKWYNEDPDHTRIRSNYVINKFLFYKNNKLLTAPYNDTSYLLTSTLADIEEKITELDSAYESKQKQLDRIIQFENNEIVVITPLTYEAAKKYGSNTKWCVSAWSTMAMYDALCTNDRRCFMFCPKKQEDKHILYVHKNDAIEFTDREDNPLTMEDYTKYLDKFNIPNTFCSFAPTCLRKYYYLKPKCFYCSVVQNCDKREVEELKCNLINQEEFYKHS